MEAKEQGGALHGAQEYEKLASDYQGNKVDWYDLNEFGDVAILRTAKEASWADTRS